MITYHQVWSQEKTLWCSWRFYLENDISVTLCLMKRLLFSVWDIILQKPKGTKPPFVGGKQGCHLRSKLRVCVCVYWPPEPCSSAGERARPCPSDRDSTKGSTAGEEVILPEGSRTYRRQVWVWWRESGLCEGQEACRTCEMKQPFGTRSHLR